MSLSDEDVDHLFLQLQRRATQWDEEARTASGAAGLARCLAFASTVRWAIREVEFHQMYAQQRFAAGRGPTIARALAGAVSALSQSRRVSHVALGKALDDSTAYEFFRSGEREPTLTEFFQLASALRVTPEALMAALVMRLETLGDVGRDVLLDYVGLGRIYVLKVPGHSLTPPYGEALYSWSDCFRIGRALNKDRQANGEPPITDIAVYTLAAEVPLT